MRRQTARTRSIDTMLWAERVCADVIRMQKRIRTTSPDMCAWRVEELPRDAMQDCKASSPPRFRVFLLSALCSQDDVSPMFLPCTWMSFEDLQDEKRFHEVAKMVRWRQGRIAYILFTFPRTHYSTRTLWLPNIQQLRINHNGFAIHSLVESSWRYNQDRLITPYSEKKLSSVTSVQCFFA